MPRLVYSANYLIEANKTNIVPQVVGMVEISSGGFAPGTITAHATFPLPSPYNYDGRLRDVSSIDCSLNGAYGRVSFAITNADLGEVSNVAADKYVGWECKVHKIIILEDGTLLGILLLHGVITSYTMTDRVVDMDVVTRINVGNTITPRRVNVKCPWVFKGTECGYSGVLTTCNKLYTDADGCSGRSNQHRFGGFPLRLPEASIGAVSGQGGAPTYQLIRDDSAFQLQRAILEFDNTFSVTDDPTNNKTVISVTGGGGGGSGTVTSVALTVPSFLSVTGSPITTSGTLAITLATQNANTVFAGPTTGSAAAPTFRALVAGDIPDLSSIYQPLDADLTAIAALTANGLLRKTGGTWAMDSAVYLTANQTITLSGDVTGTGATSIATTIANGAVTFAKMQSIATGRLLGRTTASTGPIEEITPGSGVLTWLQTPSSANLAAAVTDETGSGALVFATSPTLTTPNIGVATGTSFNSITGLSSTTPSATVTTTAVVGTATAAARADHVHSIADDAVTYAKIQNVSAASRLLGRGSASGSGDVEEITVGGGIEFNSGTGIQTTALTGDVTKTAGGTSTTIANNAVTTAKIADDQVTYAKIQNVTSSRILGRITASAGDVEELTAAQTRTIIGAREVLTAARTYFVGFDLGAVTANATTDKIEKTAHGLENGDPVVFTAATAPTGLTMGSVYYVVNKTTNDFEISLTVGGAKVTWTTNGTTVTCRTGDNANVGFGTNSRSVALLTIQAAFDLIASSIDTAGYTVTVQIANGLYTSGLLVDKQWTGGGQLIFSGNTTTPANVIISTTSSSCFRVNSSLPASITIQGFKLQTTTSGDCIRAQSPGSALFVASVEFGACAESHLLAIEGGTINVTTNYTISGSAGFHLDSRVNGIITVQNTNVSPAATTVTITGAFTFTVFARVNAVGQIRAVGMTFSAAVTGQRFNCGALSLINTFSGDVNYFPGTINGVTNTAVFGVYL